MLKKTISAIAILAMTTLVFPLTVLAVTLTGNLITSVNLSVAGSSPTTFNPTASQVLTPSVTFNTTDFGTELASSTGYVAVKQGSVVIYTIDTWLPGESMLLSDWNGRNIDSTAAAQAICGTAGAVCPNGNYIVEAHTEFVSGSNTVMETETANFTIVSSSAGTIAINNFTAIPTSGTSFDPSVSGDHETLTISYTLNKAPDSVSVTIKDSKGTTMKNYASSNVTDSFAWDGKFSNKIVLPDNYTVQITAAKSGETSATSSIVVPVVYDNVNKGDIINFTVAPESFDPDIDDSVISFQNTKTADITVQIQETDGDIIKEFTDYTNDSYSAGQTHSIAWNGKNNSASQVSVGTYKVVIEMRNDYGAVVKIKDLTINNSGGNITDSNSHISGISFSPSSEFEPAVDEELIIEYDVKEDLDELKIFAVRGAEKIELLNETDVNEENNLEISWDGTDSDDEYVAKGTWRIQFESKLDSVSLTAAKSINIEYVKPMIDDAYLSKKSFDNDLNEFTYILFRVDSEADVTIKLLQDGDEDDDIVEDMEVEKDKWYAVSWDGGNYDYDDDLDFKIIAANKANEAVNDTEILGIDLAEDSVSSNKSNVTEDYISPAVTNGNEEMTIFYNLEDTADVTITIHKGETASGASLIKLLDIEDQEGGDHNLTWNGRDDDGDKLTKGIYSYKIVSKTGSTDTEKGLFIVGTVGEIEGTASGSGNVSDSSTGSSGGKIAPGVIVDGGVSDDGVVSDDDNLAPSSPYCAGFSDVPNNSPYCDAITFVKNEGVFSGYQDGTFRPYDAINRAEIIKVILEAAYVNISSNVLGNLGWSDVIVGAWYMPYLSAGKNLGIVSGDKGKTTVRPESYINRAEALKLVFETMKAVWGYQLNSCSSSMYADVSSNAWYSSYVCGSAQYNLFDTFGNNFMPGSYVSRAEMAQLFYRLQNVY